MTGPVRLLRLSGVSFRINKRCRVYCHINGWRLMLPVLLIDLLTITIGIPVMLNEAMMLNEAHPSSVSVVFSDIRDVAVSFLFSD